MANVTKTPSAVVLTGTTEKITLPAMYAWVWVRNDSENVVYISQDDDVGENVAGTIAVPAGGAARLALFTPSFYALGAGTVQISAANYADCPFKVTPKGGEQHGEAVGGGGSGVTLTKLAKINVAAGSWQMPYSLYGLTSGTWLYIIFNDNYRTFVQTSMAVNGVYVAYPTLQASTPVAECRIKLLEQSAGEFRTNIYSTLQCTMEVYKVEGIVENEN